MFVFLRPLQSTIRAEVADKVDQTTMLKSLEDASTRIFRQTEEKTRSALQAVGKGRQRPLESSDLLIFHWTSFARSNIATSTLVSLHNLDTDFSFLILFGTMRIIPRHSFFITSTTAHSCFSHCFVRCLSSIPKRPVATSGGCK